MNYYEYPDILTRIYALDEKLRMNLTPAQRGVKPAWSSRVRFNFRHEEEDIWKKLSDKKITEDDALIELTKLIEAYYKIAGMTKQEADKIVRACKTLNIPAQLFPIPAEEMYGVMVFESRRLVYKNFQAARLMLMSQEIEFGK
jgi:hypothetical protein